MTGRQVPNDLEFRTAFLNEQANRQRLWALAVAIWLSLGVAVCVKAVVSPNSHTTFPCFAAGSNCWWADANMYHTATAGHEYRYSPTFSVLFTPLACLPPWLGGMLWGGFNVGLLFVALNVLRRDVLPNTWSKSQHGGWLLLTVLGSITALWNGQSNPLVFSLVALAASAVVRRAWWKAALLLAVPVYIKVWPIAAALLFLACWPRPLLARFTVCCAGLAAIPFLTKPPAVVLSHYQNWIEALTGPMQVRHFYRDAWTIWEVLHPPVNPAVYAVFQLGFAALVLIFCLSRLGAGDSPRRLATCILCLWTAWQLLFGPGTERTTVCIILPLMSYSLMTSFEQHRGRVLASSAYCLTTLFTFGDCEKLLMGRFPAIQAAIPVGVLLFAMLMIRQMASAASSTMPAAGAITVADDITFKVDRIWT